MPARRRTLTKATKQKIAYCCFLLAWTALSLIGSQFIISFIMQLFLGSAFEKPIWTLVFYLISYGAALALIIFLPPRLLQQYYRTKQKRLSVAGKTPTVPAATLKEFSTSPQELGVMTPPSFVDIGLAPIGYVAYLFVAKIFELILSLLPWYNPDQSQDVGFSYFITTPDRIIAMIAIILVAPIAEEIVFRGWLYTKLRTKINYPLAMLLTSLLFGLMHGQLNVAAATFGLSLVLCTLHEVTGSIWSGILLHMLSNGIAFYILYIVL